MAATAQAAFAGGYNSSITTQRTGTVLQPIEDVVIVISPLNSKSKTIIAYTDKTGVYNFEFTQPVILQLSHPGYATITDTLTQAAHKTYQLVSVQNISDVVITGQYTPGSAAKSVYPIQIINSAELKAKGANNLREALQGRVNIDQGQDPVFGSSVGINGISGEGIKIMVDGVPVIGRIDGKVDLSQINLNNIDHIEIVEGPLSVIYGTDALGGVINIITKTFQAEKVNINLKGYYETVGQYNIELNTGFALGRSQLYLSGGRNFFSGYTTMDSIQRFKEWKPKEQYFADAKYIYNTNRFRVSVTGSFFRELMLDRGAPALTFDNDQHAWTYTGTDMRILTYRPRASAAIMYRLKENHQLDMLLAYSGWFRNANKYSRNLITGQEKLVALADDQDTARYNQIVARATYGMPAWHYKLHFLFGLDVNQEFVQQNRIAGSKKKIGDYAAFGSARISVVEGLDIQPGIRFAYNTQYRTPLIPSLNIKYNWKDKVIVRAAYGRGFRVPSVKELFMELLITAHYIKGNSELKPEDGHNASASVNYYWAKDKHRINLSVSGFYNYIFNKIELVQQPAQNSIPVYQYFNYKQYNTYGGQVGLTYQWQRLQVSAMAMLTGYQIKYNSNPAAGLKQLSPDITAGVNYMIPKAELNLYVAYKYNGVKPLFNYGTQFNAGTRDGYHMLDISLSRNFWKDRIQLTVGGKNLAGVKNVRTRGVDVQGHSANANMVNIGWGQTFFTSLILHFSK